MATGNTLHIINHFEYPITLYVGGDDWNCCDAPLPNQKVGYVQPQGVIDLGYCRKDGHGCNGRQGQFQLEINSGMTVDLNFDADGNMAEPSATSGCQAAVSPGPGSTYNLIVYAG
ncbi:MAG: hypothetical protein EON86_20835 [Brevundimonas sp.]|nr:MAG: hypothetical protein EON86_20835 [Brevundimonas sp.]